MKKYFYLVLFILTSSVILTNCSCGHVCTNAVPVLDFVNFDYTDLNIVLVSEYTKTGSFSQLMDTKVYTNGSSSNADTLQIGSDEILINSTSDYIITIPAVNMTWYLKNINIHADKMQASSCTGGMDFYLNDSLHTIFSNNSAANLPGLIKIYK